MGARQRAPDALRAHYWDTNFVRVEGDAPRARPPRWSQAAETFLPRLAHRKLEVEDEANGARLRAVLRGRRLDDRPQRDDAPRGRAVASRRREVSLADTRALRLEWSGYGQRRRPSRCARRASGAVRRAPRDARVRRARETASGGLQCWSPPRAGRGRDRPALRDPDARGRGIGGRSSGRARASERDVAWIAPTTRATRGRSTSASASPPCGARTRSCASLGLVSRLRLTNRLAQRALRRRPPAARPCARAACGAAASDGVRRQQARRRPWRASPGTARCGSSRPRRRRLRRRARASRGRCPGRGRQRHRKPDVQAEVDHLVDEGLRAALQHEQREHVEGDLLAVPVVVCLGEGRQAVVDRMRGGEATGLEAEPGEQGVGLDRRARRRRVTTPCWTASRSARPSASSVS